MIWKSLLGLALPLAVKAAALRQSHRFICDPGSEILNLRVIRECGTFLETAIDRKEKKEAVESKRSFLTFLRILNPAEETKSSAGKKGKKLLKKGTENEEKVTPVPRFDEYENFNFPICSEALELAIDALSSQEVAQFARQAPKYFWSASSEILNAIPDYSAFTVEDVKAYDCGILLEIKSAVWTLPVDTLVEAMAKNHFIFGLQAQEYLKMRTNDLALAGLNDVRVLYQYFCLYFDDKQFKVIEASLAKFTEAPSQKPTYSKKKYSNIKKAEEVETPVKNSFGNLIDVAPVKKFKDRIPLNEYKMLALSYALNMNFLIVILFNSLHGQWSDFEKGRKLFLEPYIELLQVPENLLMFEEGWEESSLKMFQLYVKDLKQILSERKKLLAEFSEDSELQFLLSVPFDWHCREDLKRALEPEQEYWCPLKARNSSDLVAWLWNLVFTDFKKISDFPFQYQTTDETLKTFFEFINKNNLSKFAGGLVGSSFFKLLFCNNPDARAINYTGTLSHYAAPFVPNYGGVLILNQESTVSEKTRLKISDLMNHASNAFNALKSGELMHENYHKLVQYKRAIERFILENLLPQQVRRLLEVEPGLIDSLSNYPELLGAENISFLAKNNAFPVKLMKNLPATLITKLKDWLNFDDLSDWRRGLVGIPTDKVLAYLKSINYCVYDTIGFLKAVNKKVIFDAIATPTEDSIRLLSFFTPLICESQIDHRRPLYQLPEVVEAVYKQTKDVTIVLRAGLHWILLNELNFMKLLSNQTLKEEVKNSYLLMLFEVEAGVQKKFLELFDKLEDNSSLSSNIRAFLEHRVLSPVRASWIRARRPHPFLGISLEFGIPEESIGVKFMFETIDKVFNGHELHFECQVAANLIYLGTDQQSKLRSDFFAKIFFEKQNLSSSIIIVVRDIMKYHKVLIHGHSIIYDPVVFEANERAQMEVEEKREKRRVIIEKLQAAGKQI